MKITLIQRRSDDAMFRPSFPEPHEYAEHGGPMDGLLSGKRDFFFRGIRRERVGWWIFKRWRWVDTGEIWKPESGEFRVLGTSD